ncbi:hypothetical protein lerEdw1_003046 [Lerista edwardsae]|nr:hypothetical protein lerEdw1_003046 [Lerista edwardsae]
MDSEQREGNQEGGLQPLQDPDSQRFMALLQAGCSRRRISEVKTGISFALGGQAEVAESEAFGPNRKALNYCCEELEFPYHKTSPPHARNVQNNSIRARFTILSFDIHPLHPAGACCQSRGKLPTCLAVVVLKYYETQAVSCKISSSLLSFCSGRSDVFGSSTSTTTKARACPWR